MSKFYITTAIDYPNARPHIGTAFEKIGADVQARFRRFVGQDVYFLMGNDENTLKVYRRADELDEDPRDYVNRMAEEFKAVWKALDISNDDFIQTTEKRHAIGVRKFIQTVYDAGYIYKKPFKSLYCNGCEEFKTAKSLVNGKCPNHPNEEVYEASEDNYFFKLSEFKGFILDLYVAAFDSAYVEVLPESRLNEMKAFVEAELEDISISRVNQNWGILCPFDEGQAIYVWFDALLNYLTGVGFGTDEEKFDKWWPANVHVIGKDITRFHCALWLAMIAAYNKKADKKIPFPEKVFAHGFIYQKKGEEQVKVSKSGGAYIDPAELVLKYGSDAYRYYFLSKCSFGSDGEYSLPHFHEVYNSELANNLGNLASRVGNLILKNYDGRLRNATGIYRQDDPKDFIGQSQFDLLIDVNTFPKNEALTWAKNLQDFDYRRGLAQVWDILIYTNKYLEDTKPWNMVKTDKLRCSVVLRNALIQIRLAAVLLKPYLPKLAEKLYKTYNFSKKWEDVDWTHLLEIAEKNDVGLDEVSLNPDSLIDGKYPVLVPRME
jgi:methionyl-tRNA synthetase